jgi:hypothetical protein
MNKHWNNLEYKLDTSIILADLIVEKYINIFWNEIVSTIKTDQYILLLFRVKYTDNHISTIGRLEKINSSSKNDYIKYIKNILQISFDSYKNMPLDSIIFSYGIREGNLTSNMKFHSKEDDKKKYHIYYTNKLPIAMLPKEYGLILSNVNDVYTILTDNNAIIILTINKEGDSTVNHIKYFKDKKLLFIWTDTITSLVNKEFTRRIGKSILNYENNELVLYSVVKKTRPIIKKEINKDSLKKLENFITMDLETVNINGTLIPYLLCWYDGVRNIKKSYFILPPEELHKLNDSNKNNIDSYSLSLLQDAMNDICTRKYKGYKIYFHNFSKFDGFFLVRYLAPLGLVDPIIHKGKIISCKFKLYESNYSVTFMDSYLLLPHSLNKLSKSFNIESPKSMFPVLFNELNYQGIVPNIEYFNNISLEDYSKYKEQFVNKIWNFLEEAEKYCLLDCISLFQILNKFNQLIFDKFSINITKYPTIPSLAFNIFKTHYLKQDTIHQLSGDIANNIKKSYTGGSIDMYIPAPILKNNKIYIYDVNSLYPFVMLNNKYPIGAPTYFEGDILKNNNSPFGFFHCKITSPEELNHPILQIHVNNSTISPLGSWEGMYFSEELYNAKKYGYKFEILWGYIFDKEYIFKEYVNDLYNLRLSYPKSDPMNLIAKLLLNSLYGRFGMNDDFIQTKIIPNKEYSKFENKYINSILNVSKIADSYLVQYKDSQIDLDNSLDNFKKTHNINISKSSAVTAYARIHMSQFKNNYTLPMLYYTDTDSVYFDNSLPIEFISQNELGKMKLEGI